MDLGGRTVIRLPFVSQSGVDIIQEPNQQVPPLRVFDSNQQLISTFPVPGQVIDPNGGLHLPSLEVGTNFGIGATGDVLKVVGVTNNAATATTAAAEFASQVNAGKYGTAGFDFSLHNGAAPTPSIDIISFAAQGTYNDAGVLSSSNFYCFDNTTSNYIFVGEVGGDSRFAVGNRNFYGGLAVNSHINLSQQPVLSLSHSNAPTHTNAFIEAFDNNGNDKWLLRTNGNQEFWGVDSTNNSQIAQITPTYADNVHAHWKGRLELAAVGSGGTFPAIRIEAAAAAAAIGFLGGNAVVQQANASQAQISLITDANAKAVAQAFYNLLFAYSLAPATA